MIFFETQLKRILRLLTFFQIKCFLYFAHNERDADIYKDDTLAAQVNFNKPVIHNAGHAYQLIQTNGFNILTDPIFSNLNWLLYPEKTRIAKGFDKIDSLQNLKIDVILISHNHRDHVCAKSMKLLSSLNPQPKIVVPLGDKKLFTEFGFDNISELDWGQELTLEHNNKEKR